MLSTESLQVYKTSVHVFILMQVHWIALLKVHYRYVFYELSKDEDPHVCQNDKTIHFPDDNAISDATTDTIDTICFPFVAGCSTIPISIESYEFRCLVDTGAVITAVSANVWNKCLRHVCPSLDDSDLENITSVNGGVLETLEKTMMHFVIQSEVFPFEAYVIKKLTYDVILGRDFIQKFSSKINFEKGRIKFVSSLPFPPCLFMAWEKLCPTIIPCLTTMILIVLYMLISLLSFHHNQKL